MTIHYSPFYSSNCYTGLENIPDKLAFGSVTVNDAGLLSQLELRLGMTTKEESNAKRLPQYYNVYSPKKS